MPNRIIELDIMRAGAILAVIAIHLIGPAFTYYTPQSTTWGFFLFLDNFLRFSVPLFVALSGYSLALRYQNQKINLNEFLKRRLLRLLPWYLVASTLIYTVTHFLFKEPGIYPIWKIILLGKADYHLYFVPMIFTLYLMFPIIHKFLAKWKLKTLAASLAIQVAVFTFTTLISQQVIRSGLVWGDQQQYLFAGSWIFYFVLGAYLANAKASQKLKLFSLLLLLFGYWLSVTNTFALIDKFGLITSTRFTRLPLIIFSAGFICSSIFFGKYILKIPRLLVKGLSNIGKASYLTYLIHTLFIRVALLYLKPSTLVNFITILATVSLVSISVSLILKKYSTV